MSIQISIKIRNQIKENNDIIDLSGMDLSSIPTEISKYKNIKRLILRDNEIT